MTKRLKSIISALDAFQPRDETENVGRLYEILDGFRSLSNRDKAIPAMFSLLERFPNAEFGNPGPLVDELEDIPGYETALEQSIARLPTDLTIWMVNRILNSDVKSTERSGWLKALQIASKNRRATKSARASAREFIEYQSEQNDS